MIYESIAHLLPPRLRKAWHMKMACSGCHLHPDKVLGFAVFSSVLIGLGVSFNTPFGGVEAFIVFITSFLLTMVVFAAIIKLRIERRAAAVEAVLPDVLQLMSANLKAGMTIDKALLLGGQHKLGVLREELTRIGKEVNFGMDMKSALLELGKSVQSQKLAGAIRLIVTGMKSGGEMSVLLDAIARNLRHQEIVEKKARSAIAAYITFIVIALAVVAPFLFALSTFLVSMLQGAGSNVLVPSDAGMTGALVAGSMSLPFLTIFAVVMLLTAAVMGALLIGTILTGKAVFGMRYVLPLCCSVLGIFYIIRFLVEKGIGALLS